MTDYETPSLNALDERGGTKEREDGIIEIDVTEAIRYLTPKQGETFRHLLNSILLAKRYERKWG